MLSIFSYYLWLVCLCFLILPHSVLESCTFLRICPFLPGCLFYWHMIACSSLLWSFILLQCHCNFSFFIYNSIDLNPLPFFLMSLAKGVINFVYLLKEPTFSFINLCYCFLCFFFIYFRSDLHDFFLSANFGFSLFVCFFHSSFSNCFRYKVMLFFWDVSCFLR